MTRPRWIRHSPFMLAFGWSRYQTWLTVHLGPGFLEFGDRPKPGPTRLTGPFFRLL